MNRNTSTTLAVATISFNEDVDLRPFIDNLVSWVDEIVIIDDGSVDKTGDIAREYKKVQFIVSPRKEDEGFADQRNKCIERCSSDWILHLDVDERVLPETAAEILNSIQKEDKNAYRYRRLNFFLHRPMRYGGWNSWNKPQLARRGKHKFANKVHEVCEVEGGDAQIGQLENAIWHLNDASYLERIGKNVQYAEYSGDEILARGIRIKWYHLLMHPLVRFIKSYFIQGGFKAGTRGLIFGLYTFTSTFNWWAHAWDRQNRVERSELESEVTQRWKRSDMVYKGDSE